MLFLASRKFNFNVLYKVPTELFKYIFKKLHFIRIINAKMENVIIVAI